MRVGSELILALEDIIQYNANASGIWGTIGTSKRMDLGEDVIKSTCTKIKELFKEFQNEVKRISDDNISTENQLFNFIEEYCIDDFITEVRAGSDLRKAAEEAHNLCYKVRKTLIYLKKD